jgi:ubiquinone/menaquinone biosynthesis C-methylase UbiE
MSAQRVDYDRIGKRYDEEAVRWREADPELVAFLQERGSVDGAGISVLDVGCGTGIQLVANHARFPALAQCGIDLHAAMLDAARDKSTRIRWLLGSASQLPFEDATYDFVSAQFCFHHVQDKAAMLREVSRVLCPGGVFALVNMTPWRMKEWEVYRYFPGALVRDEQDFWPEERIVAALVELGLGVQVAYRHFRTERDLRRSLALYRERYTPSQLVALPDAEFREGLRRMEAEIEAAGEAAIPSASEVCLATIRARPVTSGLRPQ